MGPQVIMAIIVCVTYVYDMFYYMLRYEFYVYELCVRFSLLGIRLIPFCLYVQENNLSGGKGSWKLGECVLRRNGFKSRAFRFEDVVLFFYGFYMYFSALVM